MMQVMQYDERMVTPMRRELTQLGIEELHTAAEVDAVMKDQKGTALVVVNSVCGCAARMARPAVAMALQGEKTPDHSYTVFAGQDIDATKRVREYFTGYAPSSPQIALFKDGKLVTMIERYQIEGRPAEVIAADLSAAFERYCK